MNHSQKGYQSITSKAMKAEMLEPDGDGALSVEDARTWAEERRIPFLEGAEVIAALHG